MLEINELRVDDLTIDFEHMQKMNNQLYFNIKVSYKDLEQWVLFKLRRSKRPFPSSPPYTPIYPKTSWTWSLSLPMYTIIPEYLRPRRQSAWQTKSRLKQLSQGYSQQIWCIVNEDIPQFFISKLFESSSKLVFFWLCTIQCLSVILKIYRMRCLTSIIRPKRAYFLYCR